MKDLQHHWIRECKHPPVADIQRNAESQVTDIIIELREPTTNRTKKNPDLLHMVETLQEFTSAAIYGEHLWLGVVYTNMIHQLSPRQNPAPDPTDGNNLY